MEQQRLWIAVVVAMAMMVFPFNCSATEYTVGGSQEWNLNVNYTAWASGKTFVVGDKLDFKYTVGTHNVLVVNKAAYDSCAAANPLNTYSTGNDTITLSSTGVQYYICGITGHCSAGMKLTVTVGAASTSKSNGSVPSPSPAPTPSSTTAKSPSPASTTPTPSVAKSPSPSSTTPTPSTPGSPPPLSSTSPPAAPVPSSTTTGANPPTGSTPSAAAPSYRTGAVLLLGGSLLFTLASL